MRAKGGVFEIPRNWSEHLLAGAALILASVGCSSSNDPVCGNDVCEAGEKASCPADCAVCGNGVCEANETTTCLADCTAKMVTQNRSGQAVYHLYVVPCEAPRWEPDQLGANILSPNYDFTIKNIPPGCYHRRAEAMSTYWQQTDVIMSSAQTYTWTLLPRAGAEAAPFSEDAEDTSLEGIEF